MGNLKPFPKGKSGNPKGRPRLTIGELRAQGLNKAEAYKAISIMILLAKPDLAAIAKSDKEPIWKVCIARAIQKDIALGYSSTIQSLFDRLFGKAKQTTEISGPEGEPITGVTIKYAARKNDR